MTPAARSDLYRQWPVLIGLLLQTLAFAFFCGSLYSKVEAMSKEIQEVKSRFASIDTVNGIDRRIDRMDVRLTSLERVK